jgi:hypothetical protein
MDLSKIEGRERLFSLRHPATGEQLGLNIMIRPNDSDEVEKVKRRNLNRRLSGRKQRVTADQLESDAIDILVAAVASWEWAEGAEFDGEQMECTGDNIRRLLKINAFYKQIDSEFNDEAAFFQE